MKRYTVNLIKKVKEHLGLDAHQTAGHSICVLLSAALISLTGCSDDLDFRNSINNINQGGVVEINFSIPEAEHVVITRVDDNDNGNERKLDGIALFVFNSEGSQLLQRTDITPAEMTGYSTEGNRSFPYTLVLSGNAVNEANPKILAVANTVTGSGDLFAAFTSGANKSVSELKEVISNGRYYKNHTSGAFLMSGEYKADDKKIFLYRTAAKITLKDYITDNEKFYLVEDENNSYSTYNIHNTANSSYAAAWLRETKYTNTSAEGASTLESSTRIVNNGYRYDSYANPTKTHDGNKIWTYVVIHGNYKGKEGFYAVAFKDKNGNPLDILPNYWYEMKLMEVSVAGYADVATALENPFETGIVVDIHDHAPNVLSMVSDGLHELGATYSIELDNDNWSKPLNVKCLTKDDEDDFNFNDLSVKVIEGTDWLSLSFLKEVLKEETDRVEDPDDFGHQYEYTVSPRNKGALYSDREGVILVTWKGLERRVKVTYNANFQADYVSDIELTIKNYAKNHTGDELYDPITIKSYWKFIGGMGESTNMGSTQDTYEDTPRLFGVTPDDLHDNRVRNEGFHFPMPYGTTTLSEYEYRVDLSKLIQVGKEFNTPTATVTEDDSGFFNKYLSILGKIEDGKPVVELSMKEINEADRFTYTTAKIEFEITYKDDSDPSILELDLYHTGFFHFTNDERFYVEDSTHKEYGYYYYGVPTLNGRPWLDRNIGAKSSKRFGSRASGDYLGEPDAGGKYFSITETPELYKDPVFDESMCPPGYKIPSSSEWNDIRLSPNFKTQNRNVDGEIYMSTFFDTGSDQMGEVFFQKGRFYNKTNSYYSALKTIDCDKANSGDDLSGYYWTTTVAPATEKEQMGKWLRVLYLYGTSSTYTNGTILDHKYYVRCTAIDEEYQQTDHYISFKVHNATHVYLFAYDFDEETGKATTTPMYTFPGHALGTTLSASQWQYFYTTTSIDLEKIYVVFTKLQSDGSTMVYTMKRTDDGQIDTKNFNKSTHFGNDILNPENAWSIIDYNHHYFDFCDVSFEHDEKYIYVTEEEKDGKISSGDCSGNIFDTGIEGGNQGKNKEERFDVSDGESFKNGDIVKFIWPMTINGRYYPKYFAWSSRQTGGNYILTTNHQEDWDNGVSANTDGDNYTYQHPMQEEATYFTARVYAGYQDYLTFEILIDSSANKVILMHDNDMTYGGNITPPDRSNGSNIWTIKLYDYDGIEGSGDNQGGNSGGGDGPTNPPTPPELKEGDFIWEGSEKEWGFKDIGLTNDNYDWNSVTPNSELYIYFEDNNNSAQIMPRVKDYPDQNDNAIPGLQAIYASWSPWSDNFSNPIKIILTADIILYIKDHGGLVFNGGNCILTKVVISIAK